MDDKEEDDGEKKGRRKEEMSMACSGVTRHKSPWFKTSNAMLFLLNFCYKNISRGLHLIKDHERKSRAGAAGNKCS